MLDADTKSSFSDASLDLPPSYDVVAAGSSSPSTSSTAGAAPRAPPKDTLHFFQAPPSFEPLFGRKTTPQDVLEGISYSVKAVDLVTFDSRLQDPNVLYDWIRHRALFPPKLSMRCLGAHWFTPERDEFVNDRDGPRQRKRGNPERVVDFDFTIDLSPVYAHPDNFSNVHLSIIRPDFPALRGTPYPSFSADFAPPTPSQGYTPLLGATDAGVVPDKAYRNLCEEWTVWSRHRGLPHWTNMQDTAEFWESRNKGKGTAPIALSESTDVERNQQSSDLASQATLREWCEKYAADPGMLKAFTVPIQFWGWNLEALGTAVEGAIKSTGYNSNEVKVEVNSDTATIMVLPPNLLSRAVNFSFTYFLLWITLLYPLMWLWQRLYRYAGNPYRVARISFGMKFYPPLPSTFPAESLEAASDRLGGMYKIHSELPKPAQLAYGPQGVHYLSGRKEGEWFREWEERIRQGVRMRYKGALAGGGEEDAGAGLDGY